MEGLHNAAAGPRSRTIFRENEEFGPLGGFRADTGSNGRLNHAPILRNSAGGVKVNRADATPMRHSGWRELWTSRQ